MSAKENGDLLTIRLTKREHFAGMAMQAFITAKPHTSHYTPEDLSARAVVMADALVTELYHDK